jgi:hypothetical protein
VIEEDKPVGWYVEGASSTMTVYVICLAAG